MWSDNETTDDLFGFRVHADLIRELIMDPTVLPATIYEPDYCESRHGQP
jgi:hypothetical protein